jgi:citrate lyase alpha subunit
LRLSCTASSVCTTKTALASMMSSIRSIDTQYAALHTHKSPSVSYKSNGQHQDAAVHVAVFVITAPHVR